jgi:hypothetical protein
MRCNLCLNNPAGPIGLCPTCLVLAYPHGATRWVREHMAPMPSIPPMNLMTSKQLTH